MAPRKYATWPIFSISARRLSGPCQQFSTLQPAAVACQHLSNAYRVRLNGSASGLWADTLRSTYMSYPRKRESTAPGAFAPDYSGPVLVLAFTRVFFDSSASATSSRPRE